MWTSVKFYQCGFTGATGNLEMDHADSTLNKRPDNCKPATEDRIKLMLSSVYQELKTAEKQARDTKTNEHTAGRVKKDKSFVGYDWGKPASEKIGRQVKISNVSNGSLYQLGFWVSLYEKMKTCPVSSGFNARSKDRMSFPKIYYRATPLMMRMDIDTLGNSYAYSQYLVA
ncbi:hypothetical protein TrRE_jg13052, partial [Triparma retinervis]